MSVGGAASTMISAERSLGYKLNVPVERRRSRETTYQPCGSIDENPQQIISRCCGVPEVHGLSQRQQFSIIAESAAMHLDWQSSAIPVLAHAACIGDEIQIQSGVQDLVSGGAADRPVW